MKLVITSDDEGDSYLMVYHPNVALRAIDIGNCRGWDEERRMASEYIPLGEVWYTQEITINCLYDQSVREAQSTLDELIA